MTHGRPMKRLASAAAKPVSWLPAIGWPPQKRILRAAASFAIHTFVEATSVTTAPSARRPERRQITSSSRIAVMAIGGAQRTTSAAPSTVSAIERPTVSMTPAASASCGPVCVGVHAAISRPLSSRGPTPAGSSRSARAMEPPMRPRPSSATFTGGQPTVAIASSARMTARMPPSKLPRSIDSFGACALSSGGVKPSKTTGRPSSFWKSAAIGMEPPSRM